MSFEYKYSELIKSINGDDENSLYYETNDGTWYVEMNNDTPCAIGEVGGNISATGATLDELLEDMKIQIDKFNQAKAQAN